MANAIQHNLEMVDVLQVKQRKMHEHDMSQVPSSKGRQSDAHNQIPKQGHTLKSDLLVAGIKKFSDAAWKTKKAPGMSAGTAT
jgi:hypothetical protein